MPPPLRGRCSPRRGSPTRERLSSRARARGFQRPPRLRERICAARVFARGAPQPRSPRSARLGRRGEVVVATRASRGGLRAGESFELRVLRDSRRAATWHPPDLAVLRTRPRRADPLGYAALDYPALAGACPLALALRELRPLADLLRGSEAVPGVCRPRRCLAHFKTFAPDHHSTRGFSHFLGSFPEDATQCSRSADSARRLSAFPCWAAPPARATSSDSS